MMKFIIVLAGIVFSVMSSAQNEIPPEKLYSAYFKEIKSAAEKQTKLWGKSIYGPILMVDPATRKLYANEAGLENKLVSTGEIWTGELPSSVNIANTSIHWQGMDWAMVMLPLPAAEKERIHLLAHELFHVQQPRLGFRLYNPDNNHLDTREGRIWLKLECEALLKALESSSAEQTKKHLSDAISFRIQRHLLFSGSDSTENRLELNEGMADYTGAMISGRSSEEMRTHFRKKLRAFLNAPSFVRSFAYHTTPVYGYFMHLQHTGWQNEIDTTTNITSYFTGSLSLKPITTAIPFSHETGSIYNAGQIIRTENKRESERLNRIVAYRSAFIEQPHFDIPFQEMNISFNPDNPVPLDSNGTVYPNLRITDKWGILTAEKGALISPGWDKVTVGIPIRQTANIITGDGWKLELSDGYHIAKDEKTGNAKLIRK